MSIFLNNMIAGCLPRSKEQKAEAIVLLTAKEALDTKRVHLIISETDTHIFYLAIPSADLASAQDIRTPLAAALPGHPDHRGDASYIFNTGIDAVGIVRRGDTLRLISNSAEAVADALEEEGLEIHDVADAMPQAFYAPTSRDRARSEELTAKITRYAMIWGLVAAAAAGLLAAAQGFSRQDTTPVDSLKRVANEVQLQQPYAKDLASIQQISAVVVKAGGWIESYSLEKEAVYFDVRLPQWVAPSVIASFGSDVTTELDPKTNMISVVKGKKQ